jgi:O-antigen/teichoic acid export membrane protein
MDHKVIYLLLSNFLGICLTVILCSKKINITIRKVYFDAKLLFEKCRSGFILVLGYFAYWVVNGADRWIVLKILGDHQLGIYAIAARLSSVLEPLLLTPVIAAYLPVTFKNYANKRYHEHLLIISAAIIIGFVLFTLAAVNFLPFVLSSKTPKEVYQLMPYFILGYAFYFIAQLSANILVYKKNFIILFKNISIVAATNIVLNIFLLKKLGIIGSAYAFLIANVFWMILSIYDRKRIINKLELENLNEDC